MEGNVMAAIPKKADEVIKVYKHVLDAYDDSTEKSEENVRFVINQPYTKTELDEAALYNKPMLKYNILIPSLLAIVGNEQLYKRKALFKARNRQTAEVVELLQSRFEAIIDEQNLEEKLQATLFDALMLNKGGWLQRDIKMNDEGYRDFFYEVANGMRIYADPETLANDFMLKKTRYILKEGWYPAEEAIETYDLRSKALSLIKNELEVGWYEKLQRTVRRFYNKEYSQRITNIYDKDNDLVLILELHKKVRRLVYRCYNEEGSYFELTPMEFDEEKKTDSSITIIDSAQKEVIHVTTIIPYFDNVVAFDEDIEQKVCRFDVFNILSYAFNIPLPECPSLIDLLKDIQSDVNKGKSQQRDLVTQILGGGFFIDKREEDAIKLLQEEAGKTNLVVPLKNMGIKPERFHPGNVPSEVLLNAENSMAFSDRISLINSAMRGDSQKSGESGTLFDSKVERATTAINPYFKNVSNCRYAIAVDFADMVGDVYSEFDRPITVKNEKGGLETGLVNIEMLGEIMNDIRNPSLYVELDEGEQNATTKEVNFNKLLAIYNLIIQANPAVAARLVAVLVEQAPVAGVDKFLNIINEELQKQSAGSEEAASLDKARQVLENKALENQTNQQQSVQ